MKPLAISRPLQVRVLMSAMMAATLLFVAACSSAVAAAPSEDEVVRGPGSSAGMCAAGMPDCSDVVTEPDHETVTAVAFDLLGRNDADLADDVRIARRGSESFALTQDVVIGRMTVELDADEAGVMVVTQVLVETDGMVARSGSQGVN